jgi:hypothetical protein
MRHWRLCHSSIANHAFAFRAALACVVYDGFRLKERPMCGGARTRDGRTGTSCAAIAFQN